MNMKKRLLALFLAFVMAMSLLPVSVFADGGTTQPISSVTNTENGVTVTKSVSQKENGQYDLTLEAYASNQLTTTTTTTPLDIVLVLDVSGSMDYGFSGGVNYTPTENKGWSYNDIYRNETTYYYRTESGEYKVVRAVSDKEWHGFHSEVKYTLQYEENEWGIRKTQIPGSVEGTSRDEPLWNGVLYTLSVVDRMGALQNAVGSFIDSVAENAQKNNIDHQISLVKFAGNNSNDVGDDTYWEWFNYYNYSQIVKGLTDVRNGGATELKNAVNALDPMGATRSDFGMEHAKTVLNGARDSSKKVVVLFTDGQPTSGQDFEADVANAAISTAKTLKENSVTVYTVGIFDGANPNEHGDANDYMNGVSSNYPSATSYNNLGERASGDYYFAAASANSLNDVFKNIADEVTTGTLTANPDADSVLSDKLSGYFAFPAGMSNDEVEVKYAPATEYDAGSRTFTFGAAGALPVGADNPTVEINGDTITIKGFDYKDYAATYDSAENTVSGGKLVVTFPIVAKQSYTAWQAGVHNYDTNDAASLTYKMNEGEKKSTTLTTSPTAPVTAYTVTYNTGGATVVTDNRAYISGQTATVKAAPEYEGHTFNGWKTGNKTYQADDTFFVTGNVALTAQWTENVVPTPDPNWDVSRSKTAENLVKQNDGSYTSEVTLSLPSAQEQLVSDVVFVLDKSTSTKVEAEMMSMLNALNQQVKGEGAVVNVGVVIFNKEAHRVLELTQLNDANMSSIRAAIETEISSGTNTHAGLLAGKAMLDGDSSVEANRKYLVFVSDGITYMYNEEPTVTAWSFFADAWNTWAGPDNWNSKYGSNVAPEDWDAWMTDIENKVASQGTTYEYFYGGTATQATPQNNWQTAYANSIDKALYLTYQTYQDVEEAGYNCYAMQATSNASYDWASSFMDYLSDGKQVSFDAIQNDIYYLLSAGSKVVDVIGNDFDFVNDASNLTMKVGNTPLDAVLIKARDGATATYAFDAANSSKDGQDYPYVVSYYQNGKDGSGECFVWEINVDVSNFAPVQLIYKVKLVDAPTDPGTYELPTNESATLYPKDSNGLPGKKQEFEKPTVSYTDEEEDGGGTPGTTNNYTLHYVTNGGNHLSPETKSYKWTKDYEDLPTPVRNGYTFEGWYWDLRLTKPVTGDVDVNKTTVTLYAKWSEKIGPDDTGVSDWLETDDHNAYLTGYPDSTFRADRNMTRAEVAQMFYALLLDKNVTITKSFSDVPDDAWYATAVKTLASLGMMDGYPDGTFRPDEPITRAEFATVGL
ncbi:S-layer homology domain-containing protein, partial [Flintibacter sp.]|uniref:S-layer homology domain-containing protein n=1 Tax=Flintibacter sp. TaxID=1918624 RepID=UPI003D127280